MEQRSVNSSRKVKPYPAKDWFYDYLNNRLKQSETAEEREVLTVDLWISSLIVSDTNPLQMVEDL